MIINPYLLTLTSSQFNRRMRIWSTHKHSRKKLLRSGRARAI